MRERNRTGERRTKNWRVHIVPHTHWDREWYLPFQEYRIRLVTMVDHLLDLFHTDPEYTCFTLDGQTIVLEDYLEIRPEREEEIRQLVLSGRLLIGPWYVQADEFLVSGEALIRNLLLGRELALSFGPPMGVGYAPDNFGHIAQLPQILNGFGIDNLIFSRGLSDPQGLLGSEFLLEGLDGSRLLAIRQLPVHPLHSGYCNAASLGLPEVGAVNMSPEGDLAVEQARELLEVLARSSHSEVLLFNNGCDHGEAQVELPGLITTLNESPELGGVTFWQSNFPAYLDDLKEDLAKKHLSVHRLELRGGQYANLLPNVLSTRMYLKQENARVQRDLECWAEPFNAIAWSLGKEYPSAFLRQAWHFLLQNHPHDSICGSGIDQIHEEMLPRFAQAGQISEYFARESLAYLASRVDTSWVHAEDRALLVFNPLGHSRLDAVSFEIVLPDQNGGNDWLDLRDERGERQNTLLRDIIPVLEGANEEYRYIFEFTPQRPLPGFGYRAYALLLKSPALAETQSGLSAGEGLERTGSVEFEEGEQALEIGQITVQKYPGERGPGAAASGGVAGVSPAKPLTSSFSGGNFYNSEQLPGQLPAQEIFLSQEINIDQGRVIENEFYHIEANIDGTLRLTDLESGLFRPGFHIIADDEDAGDEYTWSPAPYHRVLTNQGRSARINREIQGNQQRLYLELGLRLPVSLAENRQERSSELVDYPISVEITLRGGSDRIEFKTTVNNLSKDHRLRVLFPAGFNSNEVIAGGQFGAVRRPIDLPRGKDWREPPSPTNHLENFVCSDNGKIGMAILSDGLPEYEALARERDGDGVTIALTLLRSVGWLSRNDLATRSDHAGPGLPTPGAQCPGIHTFRYAVRFFKGKWDTANIIQSALEFNVPPRSLIVAPRAGVLPAELNFIDPGNTPLVISAVKRSEDGKALLVRFYNPLPVATKGELRLYRPFQKIEIVRLDETLESELEGFDQAEQIVRLEVGAFKIITLRLSDF